MTQAKRYRTCFKCRLSWLVIWCDVYNIYRHKRWKKLINIRKKTLLLHFFYSVYYMYSLTFILVIFSICILHVINNRCIPLQSFNLPIADPLLWGKHFMTFYSCCILHGLFETRNAHYHWIICKISICSCRIFNIYPLCYSHRFTMKKQTKVDWFDWLIDWLIDCVQRQFLAIFQLYQAGVPGENHRSWTINW